MNVYEYVNAQLLFEKSSDLHVYLCIYEHVKASHISHWENMIFEDNKQVFQITK